MRRQRTTWRRRNASPAPSLPGYGTPEMGDHPAHTREDPEVDEYMIGGPSEFAEDVHPGPYGRNDPAPALPGYGTPEMGDHPANAKRAALKMVDKAGKCLKLARVHLDRDEFHSRRAYEEAVEAHAYELMDLPLRSIDRQIKRNASLVMDDDLDLMDDDLDVLDEDLDLMDDDLLDDSLDGDLMDDDLDLLDDSFDSDLMEDDLDLMDDGFDDVGLMGDGLYDDEFGMDDDLDLMDDGFDDVDLMDDFDDPMLDDVGMMGDMAHMAHQMDDLTRKIDRIARVVGRLANQNDPRGKTLAPGIPEDLTALEADMKDKSTVRQAAEELFDKCDAAGIGYIDEDDWQGSRRLFASFDADRDGILERSEFIDAFAKRYGGEDSEEGEDHEEGEHEKEASFSITAEDLRLLEEIENEQRLLFAGEDDDEEEEEGDSEEEEESEDSEDDSEEESDKEASMEWGSNLLSAPEEGLEGVEELSNLFMDTRFASEEEDHVEEEEEAPHAKKASKKFPSRLGQIKAASSSSPLDSLWSSAPDVSAHFYTKF